MAVFYGNVGSHSSVGTEFLRADVVAEDDTHVHLRPTRTLTVVS